MTFEEIRKQLLDSEEKSMSKPTTSNPQSRFEDLRSELVGESKPAAVSGQLPDYASAVLDQLYGKQKQAQSAQQSYQQAKSQYTPPAPVSSYAAAFQNKPAAPVTGSPYSAAQQDPALQMSEEQKQLIKLRQNADALESEVSALKDQATYATDMQTILAMPEDVRKALEVKAEEQGFGGYFTIAPNVKEVQESRNQATQTLNNAGYTDEQIKALAETYNRYLNQLEAERRQQKTQKWVNSSGENALLHNVLAVPANIGGTLVGVAGMADEALRRAFTGSQYSSLDPNLEAYKVSQYASDVRSQTRQNIEEGNGAIGKMGGMLYGATTSAVDNLSRIAVAGPMGSLALAGLGSFQDSVRDVSSRGGNAMQAYGMGVATAAFEILTEKISLDKLIDTPSPASFAQALKNAAIQGGFEVTEEELNFAATTIADAIIMGDKNNITRQYNQLVADGKSPQEASKQVMQGFLLDAVNVAAESFLSGGMMSAGTQVGDYLSNRNSGSSTQVEEAQEASQQPQQPPQSAQTPETNQSAALAATAEQRNESAQQTISQGSPAASETEDLVLKASPEISIINERMTESERYNALSPRKIHVVSDNNSAHYTDVMNEIRSFPAKAKSKVEKIIRPLAVKLGILNKPLKAPEVDVDFLFSSNRGLPKSLHQQLQYGGSYLDFSKALVNLEDILANSVLIEKHTDKYAGTSRADRSLEMVYVLFGAFQDSNSVIPVQMEIKKSSGVGGRLYVTVAMTKIEAGVPGSSSEINQTRTLIPASEYSLADIFKKINPEDKHFLKYLPNDFLSEEQIQAKNDALLEDALKIERYKLTENTNTEPTGSGESHRDQLIDQQKTAVGDDDHIVPPGNSSIPKETESVGAAPQGFDPYSDLQFRYGNQPDRANDARPVNVPKKDTYDRDVTELAANAYGAEAVPESFIPVIEELVTEGYLGHDRRTNAESLRAAAKEIEEDGEIESIKKISKAVEKGTPREGDIAKAMLLFAEYADDKGSKSQKRAAELFIDLSQLATRAGRDLQLFKMLRRLTPQGQLMAVQKNVQQYVNSYNSQRSDAKKVDVEIPKELIDEYVNAAREDSVTPSEATKKRKEEAEQAIYKAAAAQLPASFMEQWNAWRRMSMLFNPKTQFRNLAGNMAFRPYVDAKRAVGAAFEKALVPQEQRTKSVLGVGENAQKLLALAKQDAVAQQNRMDGSARTGDTPSTQIGDMRQIFNNKLLEKGRTGLTDFMENTDMLFKRREYSISLASFLKARGYTAAQWEAGKVPDSVLEEGRTYAAQEAMKATFNDQNAVSTSLSKRYKGKNPFGKLMNVAAEGVLPFRRTPANVAVRAVEYSPAGLVKAVSYDIAQVKAGKMTAAECIDHLSAGLAGTGAMVLGYALASGIFGIRLVGALDDEDEERMGHQAYAIEIGDRSFTIDWLAPANIPLFVGANLHSAMEKVGEEDVSAFTAFVDAVTDTLEPMLELSCLSSLNDLLQDVSYAEKSEKIYAVASSIATSYIMQGLPTIFSQWDTAANKRRQTVYQDSSDPVLGEVQRLLGRVFQKLPGDPYQTDYVDAWGRTEDQTAYGVVESLLLPFYGNKITHTTLETELQRLNEVQDTNVSPSTPSKTITANGVKRRLTGEEWSRLAKAQGQLQHDIVTMVMESSAYDSLTDAQKADIISDAYTYAKEKARKDTHITSEGLSAKWMQQIDDSSAKSIAAGIIDHQLQESTGMTETQYSDAKAAGFSTDAMSIVDSLLAGLTPETGRSGVTKAQKLEAITGSTDFTSEEKEKWLYWLLDESGDKKLDAAKGLGLSAEDYAVAYRLYSDETNTGGKGTKNRIVSGLMEKFDIDEKTAESLYKVYKGTYYD